jgi:outer membrane receptor protein involved in Fe transport
VTNAQQIARPVNLDAATIRGLEAGASFTGMGLDLSASGSLVDGTNRSLDATYSGNALPRLPAWEAALTASARRGPVQVGYTGSFTGGDWLDEANFSKADARIVHGAFARVGGAEWKATLDIRNLANRIVEVGPRDPLVDDGERAVRAMTDFTGYPLPGRTVLVGLEWSGR